MRNPRRKALYPLAACLLAALLTAGCGGGAADAEAYEPAEEEAGFTQSAGYMSAESRDADEEGAASDSRESGGTAADSAAPDARKLVYTGSVSIDTTEYDRTVADIRDLIARYDCLIAEAQETDSDTSWRDPDRGASARRFDWTLRVPSDRFDELMTGIGAVHGHINSRSQSASDLTKTYRDNETEIAALQVQEARLLQFMEEAQSVSELLEIEDRLSDVRLELEYLKNANNTIDSQVQYSTVSVYVSEVLQYETAGMSFGQRLSQAFSDSTSGFVRVIQGSAVLLVLLLPYLAIAAAVVLILYLTRDRRAARKQRRKEARLQRGGLPGRRGDRPEAPRPPDPDGDGAD